MLAFLFILVLVVFASPSLFRFSLGNMQFAQLLEVLFFSPSSSNRPNSNWDFCLCELVDLYIKGITLVEN